MVITFMLKRHIVIDKDYREKMISHMLLYYGQIVSYTINILQYYKC